MRAVLKKIKEEFENFGLGFVGEAFLKLWFPYGPMLMKMTDIRKKSPESVFKFKIGVIYHEEVYINLRTINGLQRSNDKYKEYKYKNYNMAK